MKRITLQHRFLWAVASVGILLTGCSLDITNPNQATDAQAFATRDGVLATSIGMQQTFAVNGVQTSIFIPGTTAREVASDINQVAFVELEDGGAALPALNSHIGDLWTAMYRTIYLTDRLIAVTDAAPASDSTYKMMGALARTYKAMALGQIAQCFDQAPIAVGTPTSPAAFQPNARVLQEVLTLLASAAQTVQQYGANPNALFLTQEFNTRAMVRGFNLGNTITLLRARYSIIAGNWQDALNFAGAVDITTAGRSEFRYDNSINPNPIFNLTSLVVRWAPRQNYGLPPALVDPADSLRTRFFITNRSGGSVLRNLPVGSHTVATSPFGAVDRAMPVFRPGEVALIRAEAQARLNNIAGAITELNRVRQKTPAQDYLGLGASLPAYSGAQDQASVLLEIYRQRCSELFMTGMRMADARRFGRPAPAQAPTAAYSPAVAPAQSPFFTIERTRNFYPYPQSERDNNPNVPADPAN